MVSCEPRIRLNAPMPDDWKASALAWIDWVDSGDPSRVHLLDGPLLDLAAPAGKLVLDIGCGEGRFCRMLEVRGAVAFGVDPVLTFVEQAQKRGRNNRFTLGRAEALPFRTHSFDLAVSYLTLIDIPDFRRGIDEIGRVLRPGGGLLIANLNPFMTTRPYAWEEDSAGSKLYVPVDRYFEERSHRTQWHGMDVVNYHRPLSAYFEALLDSGFVLRKYLEPRPTPAAIVECPRLESGLRVPFFHIMQWELPG